MNQSKQQITHQVLTRRRLTVEFNRPLWDKNSEAVEMIKLENGEVAGLWKSYLPGLVNWVLQMDTKRYERIFT